MISATGTPINQQSREFRRAVLVAMKAAVTGATASALQDIRGQIRGAGLGERAANMVRSKVYPVASGQLAYRPSGEVYANGESAARILRAFSEGATIRGKGGNMLAIPLKAAPRGRYGVALKPGEVEARYGRGLVFVPLKGRTARGMLCLPMQTTKAGRRAPQRLGLAAEGAKGRDRRNRLVPMFILVPKVVLGKRLSPETAMAEAEARMPALFQSAFAQAIR